MHLNQCKLILGQQLSKTITIVPCLRQGLIRIMLCQCMWHCHMPMQQMQFKQYFLNKIKQNGIILYIHGTCYIISSIIDLS